MALGAKFVSNSWGGPESFADQAYNAAFRHPGVAITVAAGDEGYGVSYPASTQFVTSVGGTSLVPASGKSRGWTESAWSRRGKCPGPGNDGGQVPNPRSPAFRRDREPGAGH